MKGRITARIIDEERGLVTLEKVKAVRIRSKRYVLLIMNDYAPTIGDVEGDVSFMTADDETTLRGVDGYFKHLNNEFTLIVKSYQKENTEA